MASGITYSYTPPSTDSQIPRRRNMSCNPKLQVRFIAAASKKAIDELFSPENFKGENLKSLCLGVACITITSMGGYFFIDPLGAVIGLVALVAFALFLTMAGCIWNSCKSKSNSQLPTLMNK